MTKDQVVSQMSRSIQVTISSQAKDRFCLYFEMK